MKGITRCASIHRLGIPLVVQEPRQWNTQPAFNAEENGWLNAFDVQGNVRFVRSVRLEVMIDTL
ncbi:hypothetical protein G8770_12860 [Aestuariicella hydrocarbonica]|uniref:Uncharacterized protein n=1 Tax=Pseudomaricurvus hydrocarbonicus TaxID=1470433 RepID=A0A9E5JXK0_9GAMM|nr:hypothetical protein [Aestuariicella hydrocarbonica]